MRNPSIDDLEREAELSRAAFTRTVDEIRSELSETSDAIRSKVSPEAIKHNVKDYMQRTGQHWYDRAKEEIETNPLRAIAIASLVAYPAFKLARAVPLPLALIGAGVLLSGRATRGMLEVEDAGRSTGLSSDDIGSVPPSFSDAAGSLQRGAATLGRQATEAAASTKAMAGEQLDRMRQQLAGTFGAASEAAGGLAATTSQSASDAAMRVRENTADTLRAGQTGAASAALAVRSAIDEAIHSGKMSAEAAAAKLREAADTLIDSGRTTAIAAGERLRSTTSAATEQVAAATQVTKGFAKDSFDRTPLLVGALALVAGGIIAASLPATATERKLSGQAGEALKQRARQSANQAFRSAKEAVGDVATDIVRKAADVGVSAAGAAAAKVGEKVVEVAESAVTTAFELPPDQGQSDKQQSDKQG